jgi:hypothetical protein
MSAVSSILFLLIVSFVVSKLYAREKVLKRFFFAAVIVKCAAGLALGIVYTFYYREGDTLQFFLESLKLVDVARMDFGSYVNYLATSSFKGDASAELLFVDQRAIFFVKIISILSLVSFNNYWLISIYFSLISFLGSWYLVKQIHRQFPAATAPALVAFLFFPSITFWSAGIIKESLAMAALFFICGVFVRLWSHKSVSIWIALASLIAMVLLWKLKYYFAGIFLSVVIATLIHRLLRREFSGTTGVKSYILWFVILLSLIGAATLLHPNFHLHRLFVVMVENYHAFHKLSSPGEVIHFIGIEPTVVSIIEHTPNALISGLFRPFLWEATNFFSTVIALENLLLVFLTIVAVRHAKLLFQSSVSIVLLAIVVYVILLSIFITLSTPNFGTLARYRVGYLPLFVFLLLLAPSINNRLQKAFRVITRVH